MLVTLAAVQPPLRIGASILTMAEDQMPNIKLIEHININLETAEGKSQMSRYANDKFAEGYEGIMIKKYGAGYECKRTTNWLKWKPVITLDLAVIKVEEGTGRNAGRLGALLCRGTDDGRDITVSVGTGYSDDQREEFWQCRNDLNGRIVEVHADAITQDQDGNYSLRFPRFERFRDMLTGIKE
jgi:DNA ligase-1